MFSSGYVPIIRYLVHINLKYAIYLYFFRQLRYNVLVKEVDLMFDDPKKELEQLEEQLLALEQDEDFERFYEEIYNEFGKLSEGKTTIFVSHP